MTVEPDRYDLLSYSARLKSGTVASGAVDVDEGAGESARTRGERLAIVLAIVLVIGLVIGCAVALKLWGFAVTLGIGYVAFTVMALTGPENEVVETECRAVPAGVGERVVAAHREELGRQRRLRLVGVAFLVLFNVGVASVAGFPRGFVTVGGLAVLLAYGAITETKSKARLFAPELVREGVSRRIAEREAVTIVEEQFDGTDARSGDREATERDRVPTDREGDAAEDRPTETV